MEHEECIAAASGEQRSHRMKCSTGLIYGGRGTSEKVWCLDAAPGEPGGNFELPQCNTGKQAEE